MKSLIVLIMQIICVSLAQITMKYAALNLRPLRFTFNTLSRDMLTIFSSPWVICGFTLFSISSLLWIYLLRLHDLGTLLAFSSFSYIIILLLSHMIFGEIISLEKFMGMLFIVSGIYLVLRATFPH
jgi:drug/metabolite transporter (DMT)-like permease